MTDSGAQMACCDPPPKTDFGAQIVDTRRRGRTHASAIATPTEPTGLHRRKPWFDSEDEFWSIDVRHRSSLPRVIESRIESVTTPLHAADGALCDPSWHKDRMDW